MPIRPLLLAEIQATMTSSVSPSLTPESNSSDIYEAYVFSLVLRAALAEDATIEYCDIHGNLPTEFVFRTSPGYLYSTVQNYCHAVISFAGKPPLEAHLGVRVAGKSKVLHECDVAVLYQSEADACRSQQVVPRCSKVLIAIECKFYAADLPLILARSFLGLQDDLAVKDSFMVYNTSSSSSEQLLTERRRGWEHLCVPSNAHKVDRIHHSLIQAFKKFKSSKS